MSQAMASLLRPPPGCSPAGWSDIVGVGCNVLDNGIVIFTQDVASACHCRRGRGGEKASSDAVLTKQE